jgi:hypothetical protein
VRMRGGLKCTRTVSMTRFSISSVELLTFGTRNLVAVAMTQTHFLPMSQACKGMKHHVNCDRPLNSAVMV